MQSLLFTQQKIPEKVKVAMFSISFSISLFSTVFEFLLARLSSQICITFYCCIKICPQTQQHKNNAHYLSHGFHGPWAQLIWILCFMVSQSRGWSRIYSLLWRFDQGRTGLPSSLSGCWEYSVPHRLKTSILCQLLVIGFSHSLAMGTSPTQHLASSKHNKPRRQQRGSACKMEYFVTQSQK